MCAAKGLTSPVSQMTSVMKFYCSKNKARLIVSYSTSSEHYYDYIHVFKSPNQVKYMVEFNNFDMERITNDC
jgi:hypothetical protein